MARLDAKMILNTREVTDNTLEADGRRPLLLHHPTPSRMFGHGGLGPWPQYPAEPSSCTWALIMKD